MHKLLIFASLLLISNCGRETKEKVYLPKIEFERTKNPNYKNYFPQAEITKQAAKKDEKIEVKEGRGSEDVFFSIISSFLSACFVISAWGK